MKELGIFQRNSRSSLMVGSHHSAANGYLLSLMLNSTTCIDSTQVVNKQIRLSETQMKNLTIQILFNVRYRGLLLMKFTSNLSRSSQCCIQISYSYLICILPFVSLTKPNISINYFCIFAMSTVLFCYMTFKCLKTICLVAVVHLYQ
jgi:hypothetical protein